MHTELKSIAPPAGQGEFLVVESWDGVVTDLYGPYSQKDAQSASHMLAYVITAQSPENRKGVQQVVTIKPMSELVVTQKEIDTVRGGDYMLSTKPGSVFTEEPAGLYRDERVYLNIGMRLLPVSELLEQNKDSDPTGDIIPHNTIRVDIRMPHIGAVLTSEEDKISLEKKILGAIESVLPESYEGAKLPWESYRHTVFLSRLSCGRCYD